MSSDELNERSARLNARLGVEMPLLVLTAAEATKQATDSIKALGAALEVLELEHQLETGRSLMDDDDCA